jgi:amino acid permease
MRHRSFGELAFASMGRPSVFIVNGVLTLGMSLILIMYALLFSNICRIVAGFIYTLSHDGELMDPDSIWNYKAIYCLAMYLILVPIVLKKRLQQLKFVSYLLITGVISMVIVFSLKTFGVIHSNDSQPPLPPYTKGTILDSVSIILSSYGFILNFFPVYSQI